jgi:guanylate kinase
MNLNHLIIKHYLKNVSFITGTACAGKSTMVKMLAEKHGLLFCGENYDCIPDGILNPEQYPNLCYTKTMKDWQEFVNRSPEDYEKWIFSTMREIAEFEIAYLMHMSRSQRVIVDTNIPADLLHKIADYNQVAVLLAPPELSATHFFDRDDPDKAFIKQQILKAEDPIKTMENYRAVLARINSHEHYDEMAGSGFFTIVREDASIDTKAETLARLEKHFGLMT